MAEQADTGIRRYIAWISVSILIIAADQATKWAVIEWVPLFGKVPINAFINVTHQQNYGAAFSFLADQSGWQRWFFVVLATGVSGVVIAWLWRIRQDGPGLLMAGLSFVLGGAIGNLIDRAMQGYVTDFIQVWFGSWAFPSFNVADSAITVGAVLLIVDAILESRREKEQGSEP